MPMLQRIENDLISQSSTILPQVQVQGPPQVHGPLPQDDQLQGPIVPQVPGQLLLAPGPCQAELGCSGEHGPPPQELRGPCGTELPQDTLPVVPVLPDHLQRPVASAEGQAQIVPPVQIMASYRTVTATMSGGKRTLRQTGQDLEAMFTNVGLHPVGLTRTTQTIGLSPDDLPAGGPSLIPQGQYLKQCPSSSSCSEG